MKQITFLLLFTSGAALLQADVIYSNFGVSPDAPFDPTSGLTVASGGQDLSTAMSFVVSGNGYLVTAIDFVASLNGGTNAVTATLYQDSGGLPATEVYTTDAGLNPMGTFDDPVEISLNIASGPVLTAGATYWLSLDSTDSSSNIRWNYNGQGVIGQAATFTDSAWSTSSKELGAFELDGTAVSAPEPMTILLFASGLGVCILSRRLRSNR
jgi:hypothetical protein